MYSLNNIKGEKNLKIKLNTKIRVLVSWLGSG